jgi:hypothetical protein
MPGGGSKSRRRQAAIAALLECPTLAQAALAAGVCEKTLRTWLKQPEFLSSYREARRQVVEHAVGHVQQLTAKAAATLERNLDNGSGNVEVKAAVALLEHAARGLDVFDLADKVQKLEQTLAEVLARGGNNVFPAAAAGQGNGHAPASGAGGVRAPG